MKNLKMSGRRLFSLVLAFMLLVGCLSMTAFADDVSGANIGEKIKGGIGEIYDAITTIVLPCGALALVIAALQFFFGGQQGVEKAKKTLIWTIIGIGLAYLAPYLVTQFKSWFDGNTSFNEL